MVIKVWIACLPRGAGYSHWRAWERAFWMLVMFLELDAVYMVVFIMKIL